MNIIFLSLTDFNSLSVNNLYTGILQHFVDDGAFVHIISPVEKRFPSDCKTVLGDGFAIYKPRVGNITNTPFFRKGLSVIQIIRKIKRCIRENIGDTPIDLFILTTPPVTFSGVVRYVKRKYGSRVYLLLKDIWPENIMDLKIPGGNFVKAPVYAFFRFYEKSLFRLCDKIGCMSQGNVQYVLEHNQYLDVRNVHVNPNVCSPEPFHRLEEIEKKELRRKHGLPEHTKCFIYGGTLGVGQNVPHIIECLKACEDLDVLFLIIGRGVQYPLLENYVKEHQPKNVRLIPWLPKTEYEEIVCACDAGLVFLRYTAPTPNIPSRILSYMQYGLPIISCTNPASDLNSIIEEGDFGYTCFGDSPEAFRSAVKKALSGGLDEKGQNARTYLEQHFTSKIGYDIIVQNMNLKG